ncbi:hypothetical protein [Cohnella yongneupensis]|uniref:HEAT repeat domain-containing protein n=1 Tax=Cohnella yongneupensis TaxID=425006 RepID=A0ABW0QX69_9BACL
MSVIGKLASSVGRKDEEPNVALAQAIADEGDSDAVQELVDHLRSKNKDIRSDCIKVLYEIGAIEPKLISGHLSAFALLLDDKNNRLVWGAMTAIDAIALTLPDDVYVLLPDIMAAADRGSIIAKDHAVAILIKLCSFDAYVERAFELLLGQLNVCPTNQLPTYAENALPLIHAGNKDAFSEALLGRLIEIEKDSKRKRVEKVIHKAGKR